MNKIGRGGIKCSCCRPWLSLKKTRVFLNRVFRRKAKHEYKDEEAA